MLSLALLTVHTASAAWPDSFPHRIAAMEALRFDLNSPEVRSSSKHIAARYKNACNKGYSEACKWRNWQGEPAKLTDYFASKCKTKAPLACVAEGLSYSLVQGHISPQASDPKRAYSLFTIACKEKAYAPGCYYLGELYRVGAGVEKNPKLASTYYDEACRAKDAWACNRLAQQLLTLQPHKHRQAKSLFSKSCSQGYLPGCVSYAELVVKHSRKSSELRSASGYFQDGCKQGVLKACVDLADMHMTGKGARKSKDLAAGLYKMSCMQGVKEGCHGQAMSILSETSPDYAQAGRLLSESCQQGYAASCSAQGKMLLSARIGNIKKAHRLLRQGCEGGDIAGCLTMAATFRSGEWGKIDESKAISYYELGCKRQMGGACHELAEISAKSKTMSPRAILDLYQKACRLGEGRSCGKLANKMLRKRKMNKSILRLLDSGCRGKDSQSCERLAKYYKGKERHNTYLSYVQEACHVGSNQSCVEAGNIHKNASPRRLAEALELYEIACSNRYKEACQAAQPIAFQGRFERIVKSALRSTVCQLWAVNPQKPEDVLLVADVQGSTIVPYLGDRMGQELQISLSQQVVRSDQVYKGQSTWSLLNRAQLEEVKNLQAAKADSKYELLQSQRDAWAVAPRTKKLAKPWSIQLTHTEVWDPTKGAIDEQFPNEKSVMRGKQGKIAFSRDTEIVSMHDQKCQFVTAQPVIQADQCSVVQALAAAHLLTKCQ